MLLGYLQNFMQDIAGGSCQKRNAFPAAVASALDTRAVVGEIRKGF